MTGRFHHFARIATEAVGSVYAFALALGVVAAWAVAGLFVGYDNTLYQLAINTGTTIVTFLLVFLIQYSQNRDTVAMNKKLDELVTKLDGPDSNLAGIEREDEP